MDRSKNAIDVFDKRANDYQDKFMNIELYADTFDLFCSHITKQHPQILELGCGPGNITRYLLQNRPDFKITGIDLSPNMIRLAEINNPQAHFELMDCRNIGATEKRYDAIMCGFCLPYLSKEEALKLISDASKILNPEGVFYISTMEDDYAKSGPEKSSDGKDEIYMHYHQADYLAEALLANNLKIINIQRKIYRAGNGKNTTDLIIIAGK